MVYSLKQFAALFVFENAKITYLNFVGDSLHLDVNFMTMDNDDIPYNFQGIKQHVVFKNIKSLSDDYFSSLNKIISRFKSPYIASKSTYQDDIFKIDDALAIQCDEVSVEEIY